MYKVYRIIFALLLLIVFYTFIMGSLVLYKTLIINRIDVVADEIVGVHNTTEYTVIYDDLSDLEEQITEYIKGKKGNWSVYIKNLKTDKYISINNQALKPASVIKMFNMAAFYGSVNDGIIELNSTNKKLVNDMITVSDNNSSNKVVKIIGNGNFNTGAKIVTDFAVNSGCKDTLEQHPLYDKTPAKLPGGKNLTSVEDCGLLLEKVYRQECVSDEYDKEMLDLLCNQQVTTKIPAGLPKGTKCANKTGENKQVQADVGIVFSPCCDYIICVIENFDTTKSGMEGIKEISKITYEYFNENDVIN